MHAISTSPDQVVGAHRIRMLERMKNIKKRSCCWLVLPVGNGAVVAAQPQLTAEETGALRPSAAGPRRLGEHVLGNARKA